MRTLLTWLLLALPLTSFSQRYFTKTGEIDFKAGTPLEDIDAVNKSVSSVLDVATGQIEFALLVKSFEFRRGLMQEHFNENYMESSKFPKSVFVGTSPELTKLDLKKDGSYQISVMGTLEVHGVSKALTIPATIRIQDGRISASAVFSVEVADFNIQIPGAVKDKIAKTVVVTVNGQYQPL